MMNYLKNVGDFEYHNCFCHLGVCLKHDINSINDHEVLSFSLHDVMIQKNKIIANATLLKRRYFQKSGMPNSANCI